MKSDSPTHNLNSNTDFNEVNFYSPKYQNSLTKSQNLNNYLKNDSIYENLGNNLVLPSINQKKNLSNSGRNIVLTKTKFLEKEDEMKNSLNMKTSNSSPYGNFSNFATNLSHNFGNGNTDTKHHEKEKLDYELSKLEDQYKDILTKFTILSKKRELLN